ncbi:cytochrome C biogenesis protein CcdA [Campylobacterota bacterium]|nr:cytochrome C biogenesis protein CcdA [Campylobacterota bacterium]GHV05152.1 cytochrome C biogenesis protein CcdA [Campylobacterota bacterium]
MFEEHLIDIFSQSPLFISFLAGILSFLAPCVLPMVPAYVSYISSLSISKIKNGDRLNTKEHIHLVITAVLFVLGFSAVFITFGALIDLVIYKLFVHPIAKIVAGAIIVVFAFHFMGVFSLRFLSFQKQTTLTTKIAFLSPFVLGLSFALGWTPCTGPILGAIMTMSIQQQEGGVLLMSLYSLGLGVPFILIAFLTTAIFRLLDRVKRYYKLIEILTGVLLLIMGGMTLYDGIYEEWQLLTL